MRIFIPFDNTSFPKNPFKLAFSSYWGINVRFVLGGPMSRYSFPYLIN